MRAVLGKKPSIMYCSCFQHRCHDSFSASNTVSSLTAWYLNYSISIITSTIEWQYFWKCYIIVVTWPYSGFYWYIRTLPQALCALSNRAYISVKPLAAVLQYINVTSYHDIYLYYHEYEKLWYVIWNVFMLHITNVNHYTHSPLNSDITFCNPYVY